MKSIEKYIIENLESTFKLKESKNLPDNIKYAENVSILGDKYFIFVTTTDKGYACALYSHQTNKTAYLYLKNIDNIIYHFEYLLKGGKTKKIVTLGDDGELHYDRVKLKASLPKKYQQDIVDDKPNKFYNNYNSTLFPDQLYGLLKRQNRGIWKISKEYYISKEDIPTNEDIKICVDGVYYDESLDSNYIDLVPNQKAGIDKKDTIIYLYKENLSNDDSHSVTLYNENKVLFLLIDRSIKYDGGNAIVCVFDKFENHTLYLKTVEKIKLSKEDVSTQFMVLG